MLAIAIFVFTLVLVVWQPRGLGVGWSAALGALLALATGVIHWVDVVQVWQLVWNATFTLVAIIITCLLLDEAGLFRWSALWVARGANSGRRLFVLLLLLGALVAAFFANDGAVLIITPLVFELMLALGFGATTTLAFVMAAGFIVDATSLPLVISNLVNILSADFFRLDFSRYAGVMVVVNLVAVLASLVVLLFFFRKQVHDTIDPSTLPPPALAIRGRRTFACGWLVLLWLPIGSLLGQWLHVPLSVVVACGSLLLWVTARRDGLPLRRVWRDAPWHVVMFSLGMYLVVFGLRDVGLMSFLAHQLAQLQDKPLWLISLATGYMAAFLSSTINNLPAVLVGALAIDQSHTTGMVRDVMIYANVIGCDLGPKITPIGSLATLLWLHVLERRGLTISWGRYLKVGLVLTLPVLTTTLLALAGWLAFSAR